MDQHKVNELVDEMYNRTMQISAMREHPELDHAEVAAIERRIRTLWTSLSEALQSDNRTAA